MNLHFDKKLFLYLSLAFICMTIIGTVSHECGHLLSAKFMGFNARINYGKTFLEGNADKVMNADKHFLFTLGGPVQTIVTGTLGLALLYFFRKSYHGIEKLTLGQWAIIFTSLFWLRQVANLFTWVSFYFVRNRFSTRGDEIRLARHLNLPNWSILTVTAIIGCTTVAFVIFKYIPKKVRLTFIASGIVGGIAGFVFWLRLFGKIIMP